MGKRLGLLGAAFLAGLLFPVLAPAYGNSSQQLARFMAVLERVQAYSLVPVETSALLEGGSRGLVAALKDPYSLFLNGEEYQTLQNQQSGEAVGIGVELAYREQSAVVVSVLPETPAQRAGLRPGDRLLSVDGVLLENKSWAEINQRLQGEVGQTLVLSWRSFTGVKEATLRRETLRLDAWKLHTKDNSICHLEVRTFFNESLSEELAKALETAQNDCYNGLVLDLRNNPGGLVGQAVEVAGLMGVEGTVFQLVSREGGVQDISPVPRIFTWTAPLVVLMNKGSASASELLAAALKESGRAVLIGETTFGKGLVQSLMALHNGTGLSLTTARYLTRQGNPVHQRGVQPDIVVQDNEMILPIALDYLN